MGSWSDNYTETITYALVSSYAADGKPVYGTQSTIDCRIEYGHERMRASMRNPAEGMIVEIVDMIFAETAMVVESGIWLPGANTSNDSEAKKPRVVNTISDLDSSETLYEVTL